MKTIKKVFAYIVVNNRLVVFTHRDHPEAGLQVPAGTVRLDEPVEAAVLREAHEETGLAGLTVVQHLGRAMFQCTRLGGEETHDRFFFQLAYAGPLQEHWVHAERHDNLRPPTWFVFQWMDVGIAGERLIADHGAFLSQLLPTD